MQLGMVGLGRMGANMVRRLIKQGHQCVVYDANPKAVTQLVGGRRLRRKFSRRVRFKAQRTAKRLDHGARRDH